MAVSLPANPREIAMNSACVGLSDRLIGEVDQGLNTESSAPVDTGRGLCPPPPQSWSWETFPRVGRLIVWVMDGGRGASFACASCDLHHKLRPNSAGEIPHGKMHEIVLLKHGVAKV